MYIVADHAAGCRRWYKNLQNYGQNNPWKDRGEYRDAKHLKIRLVGKAKLTSFWFRLSC